MSLEILINFVYINRTYALHKDSNETVGRFNIQINKLLKISIFVLLIQNSFLYFRHVSQQKETLSKGL
jgi:hypothetical protein